MYLHLKGNQTSLHEDIEDFFENVKNIGFKYIELNNFSFLYF
jgi:sugar phosphate isomerase/epimerase